MNYGDEELPAVTPDLLIEDNRYRVAQHRVGCACHPMRMHLETGAPCCDRDPTALITAASIDALDSMNFIWHLDVRCAVNPEAVRLQDGTIVRYIGDGEWKQMVKRLRGGPPPF